MRNLGEKKISDPLVAPIVHYVCKGPSITIIIFSYDNFYHNSLAPFLPPLMIVIIIFITTTTEAKSSVGIYFDWLPLCNKTLESHWLYPPTLIFPFYFNSEATAWASYGQGVGAHITLTLDREYRLCRIRLLQRSDPDERFETLQIAFSTGDHIHVSTTMLRLTSTMGQHMFLTGHKSDIRLSLSWLSLDNWDDFKAHLLNICYTSTGDNLIFVKGNNFSGLQSPMHSQKDLKIIPINHRQSQKR